MEYLSDSQDTESFVMDDLGNRAGNQTLRDDGTVSFAVDTLTNRYTDIGGTGLPDPQHDDAGNLREDHRGYSYVYDYENRIIKIEKPDGPDEGSDPDPVAEFAYDTQGRRIKVYDAVADTTTLYYYSDDWQVLGEYDGSDVLQAYYIFGNYIDEVLLMHRDSADKFYLHDHLYSPVALTNSSGTVVERYEYDAYGKATVWNAGLTTTYSCSQCSNPYLFTGRRLDALDGGNLNLMYYRARTYDPETGRFMQRDPLGINPAGGKENPFVAQKQYKDSLNVYEYVKSNVLINLDPYGLSWSASLPWSPYPGSGYYPGYEGEGLEDFFNWFRKKDCTPWENDGRVHSTYYSESGCTTMDLLEAIGPIFEVFLPGIPNVIVGIAGEMVSWDIPVCNQPMHEGYVTDGQLCECATFYKRKCKRTCCQFGKRRPDHTTVKLAYRRYGWVAPVPFTRVKKQCICPYPPGETPDTLREKRDEALDCDKLN